MAQTRSEANPNIIVYTETPDWGDVIHEFGWVVGGFNYMNYDPSLIPVTYRAHQYERRMLETAFVAETQKVPWTLEGNWGVYIARVARWLHGNDLVRDELTPLIHEIQRTLTIQRRIYFKGWVNAAHLAEGKDPRPLSKNEEAVLWLHLQQVCLMWEYRSDAWSNPAYKVKYQYMKAFGKAFYYGDTPTIRAADRAARAAAQAVFGSEAVNRTQLGVYRHRIAGYPSGQPMGGGLLP